MPESEEKPQPIKRTYIDFVDGIDNENKKDELVNDNKKNVFAKLLVHLDTIRPSGDNVMDDPLKAPNLIYVDSRRVALLNKIELLDKTTQQKIGERYMELVDKHNNICCTPNYYKRNNNLPIEIKDKFDDFNIGTKPYWKLKFKSVIDEFNEIINTWCFEQLEFTYCKGRHIPICNICKYHFKSLNDYEEHLDNNLNSHVILDNINNNSEMFYDCPL